MTECGGRHNHVLDLNTRRCRCCRRSAEQIERADFLAREARWEERAGYDLPSDLGLDGAIPLDPPMAVRVIVKAPTGVFYECHRLLIPGLPPGLPTWACGYCSRVFGTDGFIACGMICPGCGAIIEAIRAAVPAPSGIVIHAGGDPPQTWYERVEARHVAALPPSDAGIDGAIPLPPIEWMPGAPIGDAEWSQQNRKINDLLAGRTE